ncbi:hypothetical protein PSYMO_38228, partial [Pseudomonas amygdali pv. mori str. 301020]
MKLSADKTELISKGHRITVQSGAGIQASVPDSA